MPMAMKIAFDTSRPVFLLIGPRRTGSLRATDRRADYIIGGLDARSRAPERRSATGSGPRWTSGIAKRILSPDREVDG